MLNNILGISGASLMGFTKISHCYELLIFGRFIIGVNCGKLKLYNIKHKSDRIESILMSLLRFFNRF